ncbi:MAG: SulP family inorganic anion transporter [Acidimicrobiia bacterium]
MKGTGSADRRTLGRDAVAGLVLGVESVPDGLAGGLLAGVNPLYGLYGYLFGMAGAAMVTSSQFMVVQATGAMAVVVADVGIVQRAAEPNRALFTLALLTGVVMLAAGLLRLGQYLRFVPNSVIVGFISAVGVNIILGQLADFTGYAAEASGRLARALETLANPGSISLPTLLVGIATVVLIVLLEKTRLGPLGMVAAIVVGSAAVPLFDLEVRILTDLVDVPASLPLPALPDLSLVPALVLPAVSLAFVGLIQGAAISAGMPNPDGRYPDADRDFIGQGVGNLVSGLFRGMPVGGSMSATMIGRSAGAATRATQLVAALVMALVVVFLSDLVGRIAMPALAGLLIVVGFRTIKPKDLATTWRTGSLQGVAMTTTFALTIIIPLQFAVLIGVGVAMILTIARQSETMEIRRRVYDEDGNVEEVAPPVELGRGEVVVLQPYGSLFFASAQAFEQQVPNVVDGTRHCVVVVRLRGRSELGSTLGKVLKRYADELAAAESRLVIVSDNERVRRQLEVAGVLEAIGEEGLYESDAWLGRTVRRAHDDAVAWVAGMTGDADG